MRFPASLLSRLGKGQLGLRSNQHGRRALERLIEPCPQISMGEEVHPQERDQVRQ